MTVPSRKPTMLFVGEGRREIVASDNGGGTLMVCGDSDLEVVRVADNAVLIRPKR